MKFLLPTSILLLSTALFGCDSEAIEVDSEEFRERVPSRGGDLVLGETTTGTFSYDGQRDNYKFSLPVDATVSFEVLYLGTQRGLDTKFFLYGPADSRGIFPRLPIASDDNGGVGRLSKMTVTLAPGDYQLTVTTADGRGRGTYRLQYLCVSETCEAEVSDSSSSGGESGGDSSGGI